MDFITEVLQKMMGVLEQEQMQQLKFTMEMVLSEYNVTKKKREVMVTDDSWINILESFLITKSVEGCTKGTIENYRYHLLNFLSFFNRSVDAITTKNIFDYFKYFKDIRKISNQYLDSIRRVLSSFFDWCLKQKIITENPMDSVSAIKVPKVIKKPLSDEEREQLYINAKHERDLAMMEFMYSTGVRVSELCALNRDDIQFTDQETIVHGKGNKERKVYLTAKSCLHLKRYLSSRKDSLSALFVSRNKPHERLTVSGVENILREIGRRCGVEKVHPHRFRRTTATNALNKGMPLQEVQLMLGHAKPETTLIYCTVADENVKHSHKKYLAS